MSGLFAAIVGPSGAGKDSLIREMAKRLEADSAFFVVRRYVTRAADAYQDHESLDDASFEAMASAGRFALTWRAHGLSYGLPGSLDADLRAGRTALCNLSRAVVPAARARWPNVWVALVSAEPATLAARLAARAREPQTQQAARLAREEIALRPDAVIANDGPLAQAADRLYALLQARRRFTP